MTQGRTEGFHIPRAPGRTSQFPPRTRLQPVTRPLCSSGGLVLFPIITLLNSLQYISRISPGCQVEPVSCSVTAPAGSSGHASGHHGGLPAPAPSPQAEREPCRQVRSGSLFDCFLLENTRCQAGVSPFHKGGRLSALRNNQEERVLELGKCPFQCLLAFDSGLCSIPAPAFQPMQL